VSAPGHTPSNSPPPGLRACHQKPLSLAVHRIMERLKLGKDLWRPSGPTPLLKQGHLEPVAQDHLQMAFEYPQGWRLHRLSGQPVPGLGHPHSETVFPDIQTSHVSACVSFLWSWHWAITEMSLVPSSLQRPFRYVYTLMRSALLPNPSLLFSRLQSPSLG